MEEGGGNEAMHNHYIINDSVEFHPATSKLRDINNPDNVVALNSPAGRCLLLLINRMGSVVTQDEFMESVWKQNGMMVTSNAYYQNISVLRKGLKRVGLDENIIVTLPRIGLTLASGTQIRKLAQESSVEIVKNDTDAPMVISDNLPDLGNETDCNTLSTTDEYNKLSVTSDVDAVSDTSTLTELSETSKLDEVSETSALDDRTFLKRNHLFIKMESSKKIRYGVVFMMVLIAHDFALFFCFKG